MQTVTLALLLVVVLQCMHSEHIQRKQRLLILVEQA